MTTNTNRVSLTQTSNLYRVRIGVRAVLALGVAASVAANVLHAQPNIVGRAIAAWSPLALLLTVELISRVPVHRPLMSAARMAATGTIAGIAAWVSYWHMVTVAIHYGESTSSAHLFPLSVDGLVVVAAVSLAELGARLRAISEATPSVEVQTAEVQPVATTPVDVSVDVVADVPAAPTAAATEAPTQVPDEVTRPVRKPAARKVGRPSPSDLAAKVRRLAIQHPDWTTARIAKSAGCTERTVRRHLSSANNPPASSAA